MIGFATPAKYYAHMANELEANGIDVLSAICKNLGVMHPLVQEIASILQKSVEELGTHLGRYLWLILWRSMVYYVNYLIHTSIASLDLFICLYNTFSVSSTGIKFYGALAMQ